MNLIELKVKLTKNSIKPKFNVLKTIINRI